MPFSGRCQPATRRADDTTLHFATAFAEGVDPAERAAVLAVIKWFFEEINRQTRNEGERWDRGYTPESKLPTVFREWVLEEWTLEGPSESWDEQLDSYYREQPVFAMVGGLSDRGAGGAILRRARDRLPVSWRGHATSKWKVIFTRCTFLGGWVSRPT